MLCVSFLCGAHFVAFSLSARTFTTTLFSLWCKDHDALQLVAQNLITCAHARHACYLLNVSYVLRVWFLCGASLLVCVRWLESSILGVTLPSPAQRRCLARCVRALTAALFSLLCCAAPSRQLAPTLFSLVGNLTSGAFQPR